MATPSAEVSIDEELVRQLIADQQPALARLTVRIVGEGWDNVVARLGDDLCVRLPRRRAAADLIANEQRWLPVLAESLPLPIPVPVFAGRPSAVYPFEWSICPWFDGAPTADVPFDDPGEAAVALGAFIAALHRPAPADAPENPFRGVHLRERADAVEQRVESLRARVPADTVLATWNSLRSTPEHSGPPVWLHGDLHPSNMVTRDGRLAAIIDFGDITSGDPATDLAAAWMMFGVDDRATFRTTAAVGDDTWRRAAGWALNLSLAYLTGDDSTSMPAIGQRALHAVLEEFAH